jgi:predicted transposase/invertase (TIGR01784 family)
MPKFNLLKYNHYLQPMKRNDFLWKGILEDVFDDFLTFFYPNAHDIFDFDKGFDFLDKELEDLFPKEESASVRYVDKLIKVYLVGGGEKWILVHVEVQGYRDKHFEERMFTYYYRIKDKYQKDIAAWAILTDDKIHYKPYQYTSDYLGTELTYKFNVYKVLEQDEETLKNSNNIFASIILTVLINLKSEAKEEKNLVQLNLEIVRNLLKKGFPKQKVHSAMNFIRFFVRFSDENKEIFHREIEQITGKTYTMGIEQLLLENATKRGIEKKEIEIVLSMNEDGFEIPRIAKITKLSIEQVEKILRENGSLD